MISGDSLEHKSSVDAIAGNADLVTEILLHLPAKSVLRFKCVSKQWLCLISDPQFRRKQCPWNPNSVVGLILQRPPFPFHPKFDFAYLNYEEENQSSIPFRSLNFIDKSDVRILNSCNGLFCLRSNAIYYIFNPTTKQFITLPRIDRPRLSFILFIYLAFDPSISPYYKAICVWVSMKSQKPYQIEIYSSETGLWKHSDNSFENRDDILFRNGVFWNGAIHWTCKLGPCLCFDVNRECFKAMPMPLIPEDQHKRRIKYLGESRGHLHLIEIYGPRTTLFDVLEMERDYSKWFVKYRVDLDAVTTAFPEMIRNDFDPSHVKHYAFRILFLVREEKEEESRVVLSTPGKIISYNPSDKTFKNLHVLAPGRLDVEGLVWYRWSHAYPFIETLSCV